MTRSISSWRPMTGSSSPFFAFSVRSTVYSSRTLVCSCSFWPDPCGALSTARAVVSRISSAWRVSAMAWSSAWRTRSCSIDILENTFAATPLFSCSTANSRCSVPIWLWPRAWASAWAVSRTFLERSVNGISMPTESAPRPRMEATSPRAVFRSRPWDRRIRAATPVPSPMIPSSSCSTPTWLWPLRRDSSWASITTRTPLSLKRSNSANTANLMCSCTFGPQSMATRYVGVFASISSWQPLKPFKETTSVTPSGMRQYSVADLMENRSTVAGTFFAKILRAEYTTAIGIARKAMLRVTKLHLDCAACGGSTSGVTTAARCTGATPVSA
mmetsp:Transcript_99773/g.168331  ORF Transcript_99773/g.168331 Transcript_99773/m.168331 type:complete len:329 (-) Transcript_99773:384-1370(-)